YQYFRPSTDPLEQARLFVNTVRRLHPGDLPPALDVETLEGLPAKTVIARIQIWMNYVSKHLSRAPILYTNASTWESLGAPTLRVNLLWIAQWEVDCPAQLSNFTRWHFWQHSSTGRVPGIDGPVDLDWYQGTLEELRLLAGIKPLPPRRTTSPGGM